MIEKAHDGRGRALPIGNPGSVLGKAKNEREPMPEETKSSSVCICPCRLALAIGIGWALCVLGMGIATVYTKTYAHEMVELIGSIYYGYHPGSWSAAFIGMAWAFADGFVGTLIFAGLYWLLGRCAGGKCCRKSPCEPKA
jgi:hypothetical protein